MVEYWAEVFAVMKAGSALLAFVTGIASLISLCIWLGDEHTNRRPLFTFLAFITAFATFGLGTIFIPSSETYVAMAKEECALKSPAKDCKALAED